MAYELTELSPEHKRYFGSLKGVAGHLKERIFIAEGPKIVEHILHSATDVPYAYMTAEYFEQYQAALDGRRGEVTQVHIAQKQEMEAIVGFSLHQGVMLAGRIPEQLPLQQLDVGPGRKTIVVLEGIADAENMGTIIRTCAGLGADAIITDPTCCHPFLRRSVRVSMGTVVDIPIIQSDDLPSSFEELRLLGFTIVAAALDEKAVSADQLDQPERVAYILGAEGTGLTSATLSQADTIAMIPMSRDIDSLNVGVACGIFLHERARKTA